MPVAAVSGGGEGTPQQSGSEGRNAPARQCQCPRLPSSFEYGRKACRAGAADAQDHRVESRHRPKAVGKAATDDHGQEHAGHADGRTGQECAREQGGTLWQHAQGESGRETHEQQRNGALEAELCGKQRRERPEDAETENGHGCQDADPHAAQAEALLNLGYHCRDGGEGRAQVDRGHDDACHREGNGKGAASRFAAQRLQPLRFQIRSSEHDLSFQPQDHDRHNRFGCRCTRAARLCAPEGQGLRFQSDRSPSHGARTSWGSPACTGSPCGRASPRSRAARRRVSRLRQPTRPCGSEERHDRPR